MNNLFGKVKLPSKPKRQFLPSDFNVKDWEGLETFFTSLLKREIASASDLRKWFRNRSELEAIISEDMAWRYIKMTCDTGNKELTKAYQYFVSEIQPKIAPAGHELNKKAYNNPYLKELAKEEGFDILIRDMVEEIKLFRQENIPLLTEVQIKTQRYGAISGAMSVELNGQELTLQQAGVRLQSTNREERKEAYLAIQERRGQDAENLDLLFDELVALRHQIAQNAGFPNFRDYMFHALHRFNYKPSDCFQFHDSVSEYVVPLLDEIARKRKESLKVDKLSPWDKIVDIEGRDALKPFQSAQELLENTIEVFARLRPDLGEKLAVMKEMQHLDLESRKNKAPGGYNYPLSETGVPFIFMNATSTLRDLITLIHEGGHALHSFATRDLELNDFKNTPSEVAELASMSIELISMDHWDLFFPTKEELKRAKMEHLEQVIETFPWVMIIDKFQHWIYENPTHSATERITAWNEIFDQFNDNITDWSGLEQYKNQMWHKQLHLYEVPFYYIEYAMAQLGAIAVWKNYREDKQKGLNDYLAALKLGNMKTIPNVYTAANIKFDFSKTYIKELMEFVQGEIAAL